MQVTACDLTVGKMHVTFESGNNCNYVRYKKMAFINLTFMDLCIIVQFVKKIQQDATVYQILLFHIHTKLDAFRAIIIAHHQEPKTALAASSFICGRLLDVVRHRTVPDNVHQLHVQTTFHGIMKNQRLPVQF
jgi:hypothetical protein